MKARLFALGGLIALLSTTTALGVRAQVVAPPRVAFAAKREGHPEMMRALRALRNAKTDLQKANRDFGGHREKAADLVDQAIKEVQQGIRSDKT